MMVSKCEFLDDGVRNNLSRFAFAETTDVAQVELAKSRMEGEEILLLLMPLAPQARKSRVED